MFNQLQEMTYSIYHSLLFSVLTLSLFQFYQTIPFLILVQVVVEKLQVKTEVRQATMKNLKLADKVVKVGKLEVNVSLPATVIRHHYHHRFFSLCSSWFNSMSLEFGALLKKFSTYFSVSLPLSISLRMLTITGFCACNLEMSLKKNSN